MFLFEFFRVTFLYIDHSLFGVNFEFELKSLFSQKIKSLFIFYSSIACLAGYVASN